MAKTRITLSDEAPTRQVNRLGEYPYQLLMRRSGPGSYFLGHATGEPLFRIERLGTNEWQTCERVGSDWSWVTTTKTLRAALAYLEGK